LIFIDPTPMQDVNRMRRISRMPMRRTFILSILPILFDSSPDGLGAGYQMFGDGLAKLVAELDERLAA